MNDNFGAQQRQIRCDTTTQNPTSTPYLAALQVGAGWALYRVRIRRLGSRLQRLNLHPTSILVVPHHLYSPAPNFPDFASRRKAIHPQFSSGRAVAFPGFYLSADPPLLSPSPPSPVLCGILTAKCTLRAIPEDPRPGLVGRPAACVLVLRFSCETPEKEIDNYHFRL
ncbi:hypothetical protein TgHK011_010018 [Trichoderma gracile]|nr:hypothetical protein TgHK011_010018 [Trichoderma gracile]